MAGIGRLDAWLYGTLVAHLTRGSDGLVNWQWTSDAVHRWGVGGRIVSGLLPVGVDTYPARPKLFLDGYLPEGTSRSRHAIDAEVDPDDTFGLVAAYGRDLAGALIIVPDGKSPEPSNPWFKELSSNEVADRLRIAGRRSGGHDSFSSLPGLVPKITVHRDHGRWFAPQDGAPSTWIIKRAHDPESPAADVIDTETASLRIARRLGLTNVDAEVLDFGDGLRGIAVSRYDRVLRPDGTIGRLHQEDLAQAIGLNTTDPNRKSQRGSQTTPSLRRAAGVLSEAGEDVDALLRLVTFSHLIGNTDLHAKNVSYIHTPRGRTAVAPVYDVSMHLHSERSTREVGLLVNGKVSFDGITRDDLIAEAATWGLTPARADEILHVLQDDFIAALEAEYATGNHPGVPEAAWSVVFDRATAFIGQGPSAAGAVAPATPGDQPRSVGQAGPHIRKGRPIRGHTRRPRRS